MKKLFLVMILVLCVILMLTSCGQSNRQNDTISSPSSNESVLSADDASDAVQDPVDAAQEPDIERTYFTVDFFGEAAGNPMFISLNLPEGWTSDASGILDDQGNWIATIELHKIATDRPFADIDEQYKDVVSTKEMTVSGYPAKLYVLELGVDGSEVHTRMQYLYYVMVDDAYVLVFFSPEGTTERKDDEFNKIVSSFGVAVG